MLTWSANWVVLFCWCRDIFITHTKLYVPVVTLSAHDDTKLLQQLKSRFKSTIDWNKFQSKISTQIQNHFTILK